LRVLLSALLLRANMPVPADALAEAVWDGDVPPGAIPTLRSYVRRLRRALGPHGAALILTRHPGYLIDLQSAELDVLEFEALCQQSLAAIRASAWSSASDAATRALQLWRGAPLLDVPSQVLHDEVVPQLEQLRLQTLETRLEAELHQGRRADVLFELQQLTSVYPLREHPYALLMLALYRCGRQGEALAVFARARRTLKEELGAEPGTELRDLHQQILAADPSLSDPDQVALTAEAAAIPRQLPGATAAFAGRAAELAALDQLIGQTGRAAPGTVLICAVSGTAGIGKTALTVYWAHRAAHQFPDGQLYVNLRGFDPSGAPVTPADAIRGFLDALGVPTGRIPPDLASQAALYRSLLIGRRMLIVLDNAGDEQQIRQLLPAGPDCLVVVTSRRQLAGLAAAEGARLLLLEIPGHADASEMLRLRLGRQRAADEPDAVDKITILCERLPLALAIAAARATARPGLSLATLATELGQGRDRLDALDTGDPVTSVRAVFSWSASQLSPAAQRMFGLFGLHPGPDITVPAAASLAAAPVASTCQALRELSTANLLTEHQPGRYACHDLLHAYAAEHAQALEENDRKSAVGRVLDYYLHTAHAGALLLSPSRLPLTLGPVRAEIMTKRLADHHQALAWFEAEHHVLLAAIALAAETGFDDHAWQLPWAMADYLDRRGHWHDSAVTQRTALDAANRSHNTLAQAIAARALAKACTWLSDYDQARAHLTASLALYRQLGDYGGQARVHQSLLWVAERQARHADALGHAEQALALFRSTGDQAGQAAALNAVGWCQVLLGKPREARWFCQQALTLNQKCGNPRSEALTWDSLGYAEHQLGHLPEAIACYQRALDLFRDCGDRFYEAEILVHLGDTRDAAQDRRGARDAWRQALDILNELHHPDTGHVQAKLTGRME
jgi:DNA-binding SARP family transcriptional activator